MNTEKAALTEVAKRFKNVNADFLHNLTHEFLTPLSIISLNVQILEMLESREDSHGEPNENKHLKNIKSQVSRLNEVVHDSIDLLKLDTLNVKVENSECDIIQLVSTIMDSIDLCKHKILFHNHLKADQLLISTDQKLMRTCIFRLVNHACSTYKTKLPELILKENSDSVFVKIVNHEVNLDSHDLNHIFTPFRRTTEMEKIEGMSLALTIIKTRLRLVRAELKVIPIAKGGVEYFICLPKG